MFKNPLEMFMKQAEEFQRKFKDNQETLMHTTVVGESGAGLVKATMRGDFTPLKTELDPAAFGFDKAVLEELITSAYADAVQKIFSQNQGKFSQILGSMGLPANMPFPFGGNQSGGSESDGKE